MGSLAAHEALHIHQTKGHLSWQGWQMHVSHMTHTLQLLRQPWQWRTVLGCTILNTRAHIRRNGLDFFARTSFCNHFRSTIPSVLPEGLASWTGCWKHTKLQPFSWQEKKSLVVSLILPLSILCGAPKVHGIISKEPNAKPDSKSYMLKKCKTRLL